MNNTWIMDLFSHNYAEARQKFLSAARAARPGRGVAMC